MVTAHWCSNDALVVGGLLYGRRSEQKACVCVFCVHERATTINDRSNSTTLGNRLNSFSYYAPAPPLPRFEKKHCCLCGPWPALGDEALFLRWNRGENRGSER